MDQDVSNEPLLKSLPPRTVEQLNTQNNFHKTLIPMKYIEIKHEVSTRIEGMRMQSVRHRKVYAGSEGWDLAQALKHSCTSLEIAAERLGITIDQIFDILDGKYEYDKAGVHIALVL